MSLPPPDNPWAESQSRFWALSLVEAWFEIQQEHAVLRHLRPPNFAISNDLHHALGMWESGPRRLTLSANLFAFCRWEQVLETLKHEMAHQIVAELYGQRQVQPHGPLFASACTLLGISPAVRATPQAPVPAHETVAARIQKLLALGQSSNPHEAELALNKAHELALRHNLKLLQQPAHTLAPNAYGMRLFGPPMQRVPQSVWGIASLVSDFYFTLYIGRGFNDSQGRSWRALEFYGTRDNLDLAEYVFGFLMHQLESQWQEFFRGNPRVTVRARISFMNGVLAGFRKQLEAQRRHLAQTQELVWVGDKALQDFYQHRNPRIGNLRLSYRHDADAHQAGHAIGEKLRLHPGMNPRAENRGKELGKG